MKSIAALPVLIAFLVGALPAHAWTWPVAGPVLQPFQLGSDPYAPGQHRGIDVGAPPGRPSSRTAGGARLVRRHGAAKRPGRSRSQRPGGFAVTLVHLGAIAVARGGTVQEGAPVGAIGPSGDPEHAEGYVHLGVRVAADPHGYVDPLTLLPALPATGEPAGGSGSEEPTAPRPSRSRCPIRPGRRSAGGAADGESEPEAPAEPEAPGRTRGGDTRPGAERSSLRRARSTGESCVGG